MNTRKISNADSFFKELLADEKLLIFEHNKVQRKDFYSDELTAILKDYLFHYASFHKLEVDDVKSLYFNFLERYSVDLSRFKKDGLYPFQNGSETKCDRIQYDIALIFSTLISPVRYKMMWNLFHEFQEDQGKVALVGVGAGVDLEVIIKANQMNKTAEAFDLSFSRFVSSYFKDSNIIESEFNGAEKDYHVILAIELLEHLEDPVSFSKMIYEALVPGGKLICTTATDMPQFDHLYNFISDDDFEKAITKIGYKIEGKEVMPHNYFGGPKSSRNTWYNLVKD